MPARLPLLRLPFLAVLLILSALLLTAGAAHAAPTLPAGAPTPFEAFSEDEAEEEDEGEGEEEETECEMAEEEVEEGELAQNEADEICAEEREERHKKAGSSQATPEKCVLRSAHASASLVSHEDKLKLTIGYTTYEPISAKLQIGHLATVHRHLGRSGVLRLVEDLSGGNPPKQLAVNIELPGKSAGCPFRRLVLFPR